MSIATVEDVEKRWRKLSDAETAVAEVLIEDAENMIKSLVSDFATKAEDEIYKAVFVSVVASMVKRALMTNQDVIGVSQHTMTAGSYSENISYANPSGDMYLTKNEKRLLGISQQKIFGIRPHIGGGEDVDGSNS